MKKEEKFCLYCNKKIFTYSKNTCNNMKCMIRFIKNNMPNNIPITSRLINKTLEQFNI